MTEQVVDRMQVVLGERVRHLRTARGWSQRVLCERAGLSPRYLIQLEGGKANVSLGRLVNLCAALEVSLTRLVAGLGPVVDATDRVAAAFPRVDAATQAEILNQVGGEARTVALIGLRGAGKSTIGQRAARELGCAFVQLDERVCARAGMTLGEIFEYRGAEWYRSLCVEALQEILTAPEPSILEVGGSVVLDPTAWDLLRRGSLLVWLHATPEAHLQRVRDQGDHRPMEGREDALGELIAILAERQPRYALAPHHIDTVAAGTDGAVEELLRAFSVG